MTTELQKSAYLVLEDGTIFRGRAVGLTGRASGEICFNTGMTGYQEIFTDPSYTGQILITTNVHIGNYGVKDSDTESSSVKIAGLVCRNFNEGFSRHQATGSIQDYLVENNIVGIDGLDTRAIVRHVRDKGAMNCVISSDSENTEELIKFAKGIPPMEGRELSTTVTTKEPYFEGDENASFKIAVLDLGVKKNILKNFAVRDCYLKIFPAKTSFKEMADWKPDGIFFSNGPGDPAAMPWAVETAKECLENNFPFFGICLGHQILAQAVGIPTYKMHNGHRGANHPVKNIITGKSEISTQNHGFGVSPDAIKANSDKVEITHVNLNDDTIEGIRIKGKPAFSVQYHPEATPGPHDSRYLFDDFVNLIKANKK